MRKLPGVESVHVSLKSASTAIELRAGNVVTLDQVRDIIRKNGFKPGEAQITATGRLTEEKGRLSVDLAPARIVLVLEAAPGGGAALADARKQLGAGAATVEVTGTVRDGQTLVLKTLARQ